MRLWRRCNTIIVVCLAAMLSRWTFAEESVSVRIGAKTFTESVVLAEVIAHLAESTGAEDGDSHARRNAGRLESPTGGRNRLLRRVHRHAA